MKRVCVCYVVCVSCGGILVVVVVVVVVCCVLFFVLYLVSFD